MPGEQIHVPATWLTTNNVTVREARVLVHLWAKYRYVHMCTIVKIYVANNIWIKGVF